MKLYRLVALLAGLALGAPAVNAHAADTGITLNLAQRWSAGAQQGAWTPYLATLRNDGGQDFTGDVILLPNLPSRNQVQGGSWPTYRARITVPKGGSRSITVFVIEAGNGYGAEVRDLGGRLVAQAELQSVNRNQSATALLSDVQQGDQKITSLQPLPRGYDFSMTRFASAQAFPTNAVYLSGLSAIVVDEFDTASLSQAQVQALRDFVGLGGTLVLAGGSSWRRTLLPLPHELLPLRPQASGTAALSPLTELAGRSSDLVVPVVTGIVQGGRAVVGAPDGSPLVVEGAYGAGRVVELAVDPFADPLDGQPSLAGIVWSQAMARGLLSGSSAARGFATGVGGPPKTAFVTANGAPVAAAPPGTFAPGFGGVGGPEVLNNLLSDTPQAALPPIGLLGGLLVAYVLLAGLLNYYALKSMGRRELMWLTVPLVAVAFTGASYLVGSSTRGTDFFDNEVQIQRLAPSGTVETYAYHGIFAPRTGDYRVDLPANTLASTAIGFTGPQAAVDTSEVMIGPRLQVQLRGVAIWSMKTIQTLAVSHPGGSLEAPGGHLEAHLVLKNGRLQGTVINRTGKPVANLRAMSGSGQEAQLAAGPLNPGQAVTVDASYELGSTTPRPGAGQPPGGTVYYVAGGGDKRDTVERLAVAAALTGRPSDVILVGLTEASSTLHVAGAAPGHATLAAVVEPVGLESLDSLNSIALRPRLVSMVGDKAYSVDVYDVDLPAGITGSGLSLSYFYPPPVAGNPNPPVRSVDVYDWASGKWVPQQQFPATGRGLSAPVSPSESSAGVVRVRVEELSPQTSQVAVTGS